MIQTPTAKDAEPAGRSIAQSEAGRDDKHATLNVYVQYNGHDNFFLGDPACVPDE